MPLAAFAKWSKVTAPLSVNHQGLFPSVTISFNLAPGVALGDAVRATEQAARDVDLPLVTAHIFYHAGWADKLAYSGFGWTAAAPPNSALPRPL